MGYRYIGAKSKIIDEVLSEIARIVPEHSTIADLMCGTATVSASLRMAGYSVIANDVMTYSYHHARVQLCMSLPPSFSNAIPFIEEYYCDNPTDLFPPSNQYEKMLNALNNTEPKKGYFFEEFSPAGSPKNTPKPRLYFTPENAMKIDGIRCVIEHLSDTKMITDIERSVLLHDLVMAANDIANIAGTYGHYLSKVTGRAKDPLRLYTSAFLKPKDDGVHQVMQGYAEDLASQISCDLCYIDPPYIKRQYAANYHVLETLARGDKPAAIGVSGLRPWRDQYSNFCTKTKIRDSFREIFTKMDCENFLVSYSEDGLLTIEQIEQLFSEFGLVQIRKFTHKRFKSNVNHSKLTIDEYLIHLQI